MKWMAREGDGSKIDADRGRLGVRVDLIRFFFLLSAWGWDSVCYSEWKLFFCFAQLSTSIAFRSSISGLGTKRDSSTLKGGHTHRGKNVQLKVYTVVVS
jgi:hypothetical protein